jgi:hypothetical protein
MALSLVLATAPNATVLHKSGRSYAADANGKVTIASTDSARLTASTLTFAAADFIVNGGSLAQPLLLPLYWTGATTDRPVVSTTNSGSTFGFAVPGPYLGMPYYDTTTTSMIFFVDRQIASTRWVDNTGAAV